MSSDRKDPPIRVLRLSTRAYNRLRRAGIDSVSQLAALSDEDLLAIRQLGVGSLAEIKRKLQVYLTRHPLLAEASHHSAGAVSAPREQATSVSKRTRKPVGTALKTLGLSVRQCGALTRGGIKTVEQLAAMSDEEIIAVPYIGDNSLIEIRNKLKAYLAKRSPEGQATPRGQEPKPLPPSPRMVDRQVLEVAQERDIPLESIFIERLGLPRSIEGLLRRSRIRSIGGLTREPREKWQSTPIITQRLREYLDWLIKQGEDVWADEKAGHGLNPLLRSRLRETTLEVLTISWLSALSDRERHVIACRYGLDSEPLTLEGIGERIGGVTRERVRQIQAKAERRLNHPVHRGKAHLLKVLLINLLEEAGGLMSERQIETALRREMLVGDVDPIGASRLVLELDSDFERIGPKIWGLTSYPLAEVEAVQEQITHLLEKVHAPLLADEVIRRLIESRFCRDREDKLSEAFIAACLRAHPNLVCGDDDCYGLKRWERSRVDETVQALREIGEPAHYTVIAEKANAMLDPDMRTSARHIHAILTARKDLFVWAGRRGTYSLKEWGLEEPPSYEAALAEILESAERPLTLEEILARFPDVRPHYNENSVSMTLMMKERFRAFPNGTYGLRSWSLADEHIDARSAHERELKRKAAQLLGIGTPQTEATRKKGGAKPVKRRTPRRVSIQRESTQKEEDAKRVKRPTASRVSIRDLLEHGILEPGVRLTYAYGGAYVTAKITSQGTILYNGKQYSSLAEAERAVFGCPTGNEWHFWWYRDQDSGKWWPLAKLRIKLSGSEGR